MVLITDSRDGGGSSPRKVKPVKQNTSVDKPAQIFPTIVEEPPDRDDDNDDDLYLGSCAGDGYDDEDFEELDDFSDLPDTRSIASDDSFYPPDGDSSRSSSPETPPPLSFYQACFKNNAFTVKLMIRQGVTEEEVQETDKNKRVSRVANHQWVIQKITARETSVTESTRYLIVLMGTMVSG